MIYEFEVPGKIIGKGRPRLNSYTGVVYTPTRTKDYESLVEQYFLLKYPRFKALEGRIKELARMGFRKVYVAKDSFAKGFKIEGIDIISLKTLNDVIINVYR